MAFARFVSIAVLLCAASASFGESPVDPGVPLSPPEGLKSIRVKDGFEVQLVAAEPLVVDPVAIAWGPDGKLWVVEMADYPVGADGDPAPPNGSRIRFLQDTNDDGTYDKSTLFMEGVSFPNGILPWRKGVLVTAAPEIFYAEDANGDGKADKKEVLYTGFTEGNPQLRINGLRWGLDNWVYLANGWSSRGKVKSLKTGAEVEVSGRDLRVRPDTGEIEAIEGMTEFGRERDDWGDWFGCDNAHPMWHYVLAERYTKRNPHLPPPEPREQLIKPFPPKVYAASRHARRYNAFDIQDHFQSACSAVVYRDDLLFPRDDGSSGTRTQHAFVCDPVHNLVHHSVLTDAGVTFAAARAADEQTSEFFASTDNWCRPVMALTGPDGALWVVDMYRFMIEHPEYLPEIGKKELQPHYRLGEDRGRIYRVVSKESERRPIPRMDRWRTIELCRAAMDSPSGWQRDMAQMLLLWNRDHMRGEAKGELSGVVYGSQNPLARLQALCTLEGLETVTPEVLTAALADSHWAVRRQALRIAEPLAMQHPQLLDAALRLVDDPEPKVRLQLALSLGQWDGIAAANALAALVREPISDDPYLAAAVLSSAWGKHQALAQALLAPGAQTDGSIHRGVLRMAVAMDDWATVTRLLQPTLVPADKALTAARMQTLAGVLDAAAARGFSVDKLMGQYGLAPLLYGGRTFEAAAKIAADPTAPAETRLAAVDLLGRWPGARLVEEPALASMLVPQTPADVQRAVVLAYGRIGTDAGPRVLLKKWPTLSPDLRGAIVDVLLRNESWAGKLLDEVEAKRVTAADIDLPRRQRLMNHGNKSIKDRAARLLAESAVAENRQKVLEAHRPVLAMKGDATRGKEMFRQHCAVCHKLDDQGQDVGPNLAAAREMNGEAMLTHILDPNRQLEPRYIAYTATTNAGETIVGVIAGETGNGVTMKGIDGKERAVLRSDLKSLVSSNRSLMPDGFESAMTKQQLADLVQFLKTPEAAK